MVISQPHSLRGPIRLRSSSIPSQMFMAAPVVPVESITLTDLHRELLAMKLMLRPWYQKLWEALQGWWHGE